MNTEDAIKIILMRIEALKQAILKESNVNKQKFMRVTLRTNELFLSKLLGEDEKN